MNWRPFTLPATLPVTRIFSHYPTRTLPEVKKPYPSQPAWEGEKSNNTVWHRSEIQWRKVKQYAIGWILTIAHVLGGHMHMDNAHAHCTCTCAGRQLRAPGNMGICLMMERGPICHKLMSIVQ